MLGSFKGVGGIEECIREAFFFDPEIVCSTIKVCTVTEISCVHYDMSCFSMLPFFLDKSVKLIFILGI